MIRHILLALTLTASLIALALPVQAGPPAPPGDEEPHTITGSYQTTNPLLPLLNSDVDILLYDLTGEIQRDYDFMLPRAGQVRGTVEGDIVSGTYTLHLPDTPQGIWHDFDGEITSPPAVQVFATATYINFFGTDYIDRGEVAGDLSVRLEPLTYNLVGGHVLVWSATSGELFPSSLGADGAAFTADDDLMVLPAGWSVVSLETDPFIIIREPTVEVPVIESQGALNDYSALSYEEAWDALFTRMRETYPFTTLKDLDWATIYQAMTPRIQSAETVFDFHLALNDLGEFIPDSHLQYPSLQLIQARIMGSIGITDLGITDAGEVIVVQVNEDSPAATAGILAGAELVTINDVPALQHLEDTPLLLSSASTPHARRAWQSALVMLGPAGKSVDLAWTDVTGMAHTATLTYQSDPETLFSLLGGDTLFADPITARMLDSGLGYISLNNFLRDASQFNTIFSRELQRLVDAGAAGIIIDARGNDGGLAALAMAVAGHFFTDYQRVFDFYYADGSGDFVFRDFAEILVMPPYYAGPVAVLVDEDTVSAGEMFAYTMQVDNRALIVGHTPTSGAMGEVSDGQYVLPGQLTVQAPTGRTVDPATGAIVIEGTGVIPDIRVPVTHESLLSPDDEVLQAAEAALLAQ